jgi:predicted polyphosphate/ATP-dependent NAD kinase
MGGAVGLKGTDGKAILQQAIKLGAKPIAAQRAETFLSELTPAKEHLKLVVGAGEMGEDEAKKQGYTCTVIGEAKTETTPQDTQAIAKAIVEAGVDLLVYCGGDGTTRDLEKAVEKQVPVLGVPTGVKMHSALFAISPQAAARVVITFLWQGLPLREAEVMDIDEQAFREGHLSAELYGYMLSPFEPHLIQGSKLESPMTQNELENQAAIAVYTIEEMKPDVTYIVGPGTTTRTVADLLDQKKTLGNEQTGSEAAAPIFVKFMEKYLAKYPETGKFRPPSGVYMIEIDKYTGRLVTPDCLYRLSEAFLPGTEPLEFCNEEEHEKIYNYYKTETESTDD